ncbi:LLM class flavin-dependent oxidoreductase [Yaniella flava]|uniref:LLM class flavin-dependent oxidoreductase n=1 Tax=Yaniella flava TaxID=287930 RepID=A0ABP5FTD8_9MICC
MSSVPLSILDRANTRVINGQTVEARAIFAEVTSRAQQAEKLGYQRFWVAEHHSVPGIAGSSPTLLIPHLAAATSHIRLGTGGIMVPSHQPFVIAEHIGTLTALTDNRFDAGLGASVGFTKPVRAALQHAADAKEHFADNVDDIIGYLNGTGEVTAYPQDRSQTPLHILTGGGSAQLAATRGAGLVLGGPAVTRGLNTTNETNQAVAEYRQRFTRSPLREHQPHVIASVNIAIAASRQAAEQLVLSEAWALTRSRSIGVFQPLEDPDTIMAAEPSEQQQRRISKALASSIYGTQEEVLEQIERVLAYTQADEIMVTGNIWDPAAQQESDRLLMEAWNAR